MTIDLAALYTFLGMDEQDGPRDLLYEARRAHYTLPYLVLSAVAAEGGPMGEASADELARARVRAQTYDRMLDELVPLTGARVMKGPLLARLYPAGLLRAQGDIDLVVADEPTLWRAVRWVIDQRHDAELTVSVFGRDPRHVIVSLVWDAADNLSDPPYRVEVSTAALTGNFGTVPVRPCLPDEPVVAALVALAEEGLQRDLHPRDLIDVAVLGTAAFPPTNELLATVERYRLAPEVRTLLDRTAKVHPLGSLAELHDSLGPAVESELERRAASTAPVAGSVAERLAGGRLLYGMPLGTRTDRTDWTASRLHLGADPLLLTPVGDYLLVADLAVDPQAYQRALDEADRLSAGTSR